MYHWSAMCLLSTRHVAGGGGGVLDMKGSCIYTGEAIKLYHLGQVAKNPSPHKPSCYIMLHSLRIGTLGGLL